MTIPLTMARLRRRIEIIWYLVPNELRAKWRIHIELSHTEWMELKADREFFEAFDRVMLSPKMSAIKSLEYCGAKIFIPTY